MALKDRTPMATALDLQELLGRTPGGLKAYLDEIETKLVALKDLANDLKAKYNDLATKYNNHVHVENTAASYTQNANTDAVVTGSQASQTAVPDVVI